MSPAGRCRLFRKRSIRADLRGGLSWSRRPNSSPATCAPALAEGPWKKHVIDDIPGDGKVDILAAGQDGKSAAKVAWYEQGETDADGNPTWSEHVFTYDNPEHKGKDLDAADIDGDGRIEFILTSETKKIDPDGPREDWNLDKASVIYLKSPSGNVYAEKWTRHEISGKAGKLDLIELYDIDSDGDQDLMTTDESGKGVIWWENPTVGR